MIAELKDKNYTYSMELETCRREAAVIRLENSQLRAELGNAHGHAAAPQHVVFNPQAHNTTHLPPADNYPDQYGRRNGSYAAQEQLPPLRGLATESMTGVQYGNESSRANGYGRF